MGDKSPKAKQRDQKQKSTAKAAGAAQARIKQEAQGMPKVISAKGKK